MPNGLIDNIFSSLRTGIQNVGNFFSHSADTIRQDFNPTIVPPVSRPHVISSQGPTKLISESETLPSIRTFTPSPVIPNYVNPSKNIYTAPQLTQGNLVDTTQNLKPNSFHIFTPKAASFLQTTKETLRNYFANTLQVKNDILADPLNLKPYQQHSAKDFGRGLYEKTIGTMINALNDVTPSAADFDAAAKGFVPSSPNLDKTNPLKYSEELRVYEQTGTLSEHVNAFLDSFNKTSNLVFSPASAAVQGIAQLPLVGTLANVAILAITGLGEAGHNTTQVFADPLVDQLQIPDSDKAELKNNINNIGSLVYQIIGGEGLRIAGLHLKESGAVDVLKEKLTKNIITEYKLPQNVYMDPQKIQDIIKGYKPGLEEITKLYGSLGLTNEQIKNAVKNGLSIEIPAEKVTTIMDKPIWAGIKDAFGLTPGEIVKNTEVLNDAKPAIAPRGLLGAGEGVTELFTKQNPELPSQETGLLNQEISPAPINFTPERLQLHDKIISQLLPEKEINADRVKELMPGYEAELKKDEFSQEFQIESRQVAKKLVKEKIQSLGGKTGTIGINIGLPGAGKTTTLGHLNKDYTFYIDTVGAQTEKIRNDIKALQKAGFKVDLNLVSVSKERSIESQNYRKSIGQRSVSQKAIADYHSLPEKTFFALKDIADGWSLVQNEDYKKPIFVSSKLNGKLTINDQKVYNKIKEYGRTESTTTRIGLGRSGIGSDSRVGERAAEITSKEKQPPTREEGGFNLQQKAAYQQAETLSTKLIEDLQGREFTSRKYIEQRLKSSDLNLKQVEKNIVLEVLKNYPGDKIPVKQLIEDVKSELLPLKISSMSEMRGVAKYENITLPKEERGKVAKYDEHIYQSPIKTSTGEIHFGTNRPSKFNTAKEIGIDSYFGHTRIEDMARDPYESADSKGGPGTTRRVIEVQSDLYQKGGLEKEKLNYRNAADYLDASDRKKFDRLVNRRAEIDNATNKSSYIEEQKENIKEIDSLFSKAEEIQKQKVNQRNTEVAKLQQYNDPTAHYRMVREEVRQAAIDGKGKLQFPTGETAMKIEGLGSHDMWYEVKDYKGEAQLGSKITPDTMQVGMRVGTNHGGQGDWIITSILGDGKFKAIQKQYLDERLAASSTGRGQTLDREQMIKKIATDNSVNETFDISGKIDTENPIYKFYEKDLAKYLKTKYNAKLIIDKQGVTWNQIDIKPEMATQPVEAFSARSTGKDISISQATTQLYKLFSPQEVKFLTQDALIQTPDGGLAFGKSTAGLIEMVSNDGLVKDQTLYHEAFHQYAQQFLTSGERFDLQREGLALAKKEGLNIKTLDQAEEFLADKFAEHVKTGETFTGMIKQFFENLLNTIQKLMGKGQKVLDTFNDILAKKRPAKGIETAADAKFSDMWELSPEEEAQYRDEVNKEMGSAKQFTDQQNKQLATDIMAHGGLKVDPDNPGEYQNIPLHLLRTNGLTADGMLEALNQSGRYQFQSPYDVLEQASFIKGAINNIKPKALGAEAAVTNFKNSIEGVVNNPEGAHTAFSYSDGEVQTLKSKDRQDIIELATGADLKKDIAGFTGQAKDVYRIFEQVFGKNSKAKEVLLDKFDAAKGAFVNMQEKLTNDLKAGVTDKFGFKKGSKESAAIMDYGEGFIEKPRLEQKFGVEKAAKIIEADKFFRSQYDELIDKVNRSRKEIYGDMWQKKANMDKEIKILKEQLRKKEDVIRTKKRTDTLAFEKLKRTKSRLTDSIEKRIALVNSEDWWRGKIIPKRQNYYRHWEEMSDGIEGLKNAFETPSGISPKLSGISEFTKPKSKFLSFAQKRIGVESTRDAIGGFLNYTQAASYSIHIDPQVGRFRELATQLALKTEKSRNLNNFIEFLQDYSNDLAGKTNAADRYIQKIIPGGRTTMKIIDWTNKRIKANVILGNVSSSIAQIFNVPQGLGSAKIYSLPGAAKTLAQVFVENSAMEKSIFIKERYTNSLYSQFDTGLLKNTKKFAIWMTGALDEAGTKFIWNSHYSKALAQKIADPIKYADGMTRKMVAGRGVGEVPLLQKSKLFQMVAPFQLEVANAWWVYKDMVSAKDFAGIAIFLVSSFLMNQVAKKVRGSDAVFDPIQATYDGYKVFQQEDNHAIGALRFAGREAGEVLSNVPLGQTVAGMYPEYGFGGVTRNDLFGEGDPTRFGGGILLTKGLQDPLFKVVLPFAGGQIEKTLQGDKLIFQGGSYDKAGKLQFKQGDSILEKAQSAAFGKYAGQNAQDYFDKKNTPTGAAEVQDIKAQAREEIKKGNYTTFNKLVAVGVIAPGDRKAFIRDALKPQALRDLSKDKADRKLAGQKAALDKAGIKAKSASLLDSFMNLIK